MKLFITGTPGSGKTTLVRRIVELKPEKFVGFWTEELRENGRRVGFRILDTEGRKALLSHINIDSPHRVGRYKVDVRGFEEFIVPIMEKALSEREKIVVIDEIGKMELLSKKFRKFIESLLNAKDIDMLATIPIRDVHPLVKFIRRNFPVIEINRENRDSVFQEVARRLNLMD